VSSDKKDKKDRKGSPFDALRELKEKLAAEEKARASTPSKRPAPATPVRPRAKSDAPATGGSPEDDALHFHRLFGGVEPIDRSRGRVPKQRGERSDAMQIAARRGAEVERAENALVHERLRELVEGNARFEVADDGRRVEGRRVDVPMDTLRRLRRGHYPVDAQVDLHGMGIDQARLALEAFLGSNRARGERCVLVIHGKGGHSPQGIGVLRGEMAAWLSQGPASQHVGAFASAAESDGGDGAVYVLLRK
jgi:DNA-nicking Smr family endonuclease